MKKSFLALLFAVVSLSASAQFERYTSYLNTSLTGLDLSYSKDQKVTFGLQATGGYFFEDSWMVYGRLGYLNMGLQFEHREPKFNYVQLTPEVGYCFYLNHFVSIEPAVYYDLCLNKFSDGSTVGLKVGFGFYF